MAVKFTESMTLDTVFEMPPKWSPIGCFAGSVIGWSIYIYSPGNTSHHMHYGLTWPVGISTSFQTPLTVSLHTPAAGNLPTIRAVQRDCERVYECSQCWEWTRPGGRFKNAYELLNLRALQISMLYKNRIFQCMSKIFCVEFQRVPLKFHTKYLTHTLKDVNFIHRWNFKSSEI